MRRGNEGIGVDANGGGVIDPTANVISLVQANKEREDDLRAEVIKRVDCELTHVRETGRLRAEHSQEMRRLESARLDAIRQVDVAARVTEANRALDAIQALERTTAANADNLRTLVTNTAATLAAQNLESDKQLIERISALERTSYKGEGKSVGAVNLWGYVAFAIGILVAIAAYFK
jgi:hypothetical protein